MEDPVWVVNMDPDKAEIHDLRLETPQCQIDEILKPWRTDTLAVAALPTNFSYCAWCIGKGASAR